MLNPFTICSVDEQAKFQVCADRERWVYECQVIGRTLTREQLLAYETDAQRYAATTVYLNHIVVTYLRLIARQALLRGETLPVNAEQAIDDDNRQRWRNFFSK